MGKLEEKLDTAEMEAIVGLNDSRKISDKLKNAFIDEQGKFFQFYKKTKEDKSLVTCFRGNSSPEKIVIYYNNHILWELFLKESRGDVSYCVSVSFNHSRYSIDYCTELEELRSLGFDKDRKCVLKPSRSEENKKHNAIGFNGEFRCVDGEYTKDFVDESYEIMRNVADTYFNPTIDTDYFRKYWKAHGDGTEISPNTKRKSSYVEKRWQSHLFNYFKNTETGLFVYDLEFSQPFPSQEFLRELDKKNDKPKYEKIKSTDIKEKIKEIINEPDMLAIRYEDRKPVALVLVEVKSTRTACTGSSSIYKHLKGMYEYSNEPIFMKKRIKEANEMMQLYKDLGVCHINADISISYDIPIERLIILTDNNVPEKEFTDEERKDPVNQSAIDYFENKAVKTKIIKQAKDCICDIWLIRNRYDQPYEIEKVKI